MSTDRRRWVQTHTCPLCHRALMRDAVLGTSAHTDTAGLELLRVVFLERGRNGRPGVDHLTTCAERGKLRAIHGGGGA